MCSNPVKSCDNNVSDIPYTHFQEPIYWGFCDFFYAMDADFHMFVVWCLRTWLS